MKAWRCNDCGVTWQVDGARELMPLDTGGCRCSGQGRKPGKRVLVTLTPAEVEALAARLLVENAGLRQKVANLRRNGKQLQRAFDALRAREHARLIQAENEARRRADFAAFQAQLEREQDPQAAQG